jgi:hypothetical protein
LAPRLCPSGRQRRIETGKVIGLSLFVPLCHRAVELPALGRQQQAVGDLLGYHMFEQVSQVRRWGVQHCEVLPVQLIEETPERPPIRLDWADVAQQRKANSRPMTLATFNASAWLGGRRSMRAATTPCMVSGKLMALRSPAPAAMVQVRR